MSPHKTQDRNQIRQALRQARIAMDKAERYQAADIITNTVVKQPWFATAKYIACYFDFNGEVATAKLIDTIWKQHKHCSLPKTIATPEKRLSFHAYTPETTLVVSPYGIPEPANSPLTPMKKLDVVIVPVVGFDVYCHRMGMGTGYYDKTFPFKKDQAKPLLVGIAYEIQRIPHIIPQAWDVSLDFVITEKAIYQRGNMG